MQALIYACLSADDRDGEICGSVLRRPGIDATVAVLIPWDESGQGTYSATPGKG